MYREKYKNYQCTGQHITTKWMHLSVVANQVKNRRGWEIPIGSPLLRNKFSMVLTSPPLHFSFQKLSGTTFLLFLLLLPHSPPTP